MLEPLSLKEKNQPTIVAIKRRLRYKRRVVSRREPGGFELGRVDDDLSGLLACKQRLERERPRLHAVEVGLLDSDFA